jgi:hypothetical protein
MRTTEGAAMKGESKEQEDRNQRVLTCLGLSVILGIVVAEAFDFQDTGKVHLVSLTGRGLVGDLLVIVVAILIVLGGARMTVSIRRGRLVLLGVLLLAVTLAGPSVLSHVSPNTKIDTRTPSSFLLLAALEFIGAILLGSGLRRLLLRKQGGLPTISEEGKSE